MDPLQLLILVLAGIAAGVVNTLAGGGSLIGLPVLIFAGLPPHVANGTNRVGVFVQSLIATQQFHKAKTLDTKAALQILPLTLPGALLGAVISVDIDEALFRKIIGVVMLAMLGVILVRPKRWLEGRDEKDRALQWYEKLAFVALGFYGGFLQAGVGVFLLASLVLLTGRDLVRANAIKVFLVAAFTLVPLFIFGFEGLIAWVPGLALGVGSLMGGWLGARITVSWGPRVVRWVLIATVLVSASKLLGLW